MLDDGRVLAAFARLAGLSLEEAEPWRELCGVCARHLEARLPGSGVVEGAMPALVLAAGAMANRRRAAQEALSTDLRLGEVQIRESGAAALEQAAELERQYLALAAPFLRPQGVEFRRVP